MDKRTILAIVISGVLIGGYMMYQNATKTYTQEVAQEQQTQATEEAVENTSEAVAESAAMNGWNAENTAVSTTLTYENDKVSVVFDTRGAVVRSIKLKEHMDQGENLEMIFAEDEYGAFAIALGDLDEEPLTQAFSYSKTEDGYRFSQTFTNSEDKRIDLVKTYSFAPDEYMFKLDVELKEPNGGYLPVGKTAYTLRTPLQIGPKFEKLDGSTELRQYVTFNGTDRHVTGVELGKTAMVDKSFKWSAVVGKYFALAVHPYAMDYNLTFSAEEHASMKETSQMLFEVNNLRTSINTDSYYIYAGPKTEDDLKIYNSKSDNYFERSDFKLTEIVETNWFLGWLEWLLKILLSFIQGFVGNWGVAIIIMTIIIKAALFPLTHKSYESIQKMQTLNPMIAEIKEKYKDNPEKMNQETMKLYQKTGINPLGGCLPQLLQFPILIAVFGMFRNHFDLRGAEFIPGWITDLSVPEFIVDGIPFPFFGTVALRILPFLFLATQIIMSKFTQTQSAGGGNQAKMMMYMLPAVFFFITYNMPSGLLVYWIVANVLTAGQQYVVNNIMKKK